MVGTVNRAPVFPKKGEEIFLQKKPDSFKKPEFSGMRA
jgi:hypothetical protein